MTLMIQTKPGTWINITEIVFVHKVNDDHVQIGITSGGFFDVKRSEDIVWNAEQFMSKLVDVIEHAHETLRNGPPPPPSSFKPHSQD